MNAGTTPQFFWEERVDFGIAECHLLVFLKRDLGARISRIRGVRGCAIDGVKIFDQLISLFLESFQWFLAHREVNQ